MPRSNTALGAASSTSSMTHCTSTNIIFPIKRIDKDEGFPIARGANIEAVYKTLADAGIIFVPENGGGVGIRTPQVSRTDRHRADQRVKTAGRPSIDGRARNRGDRRWSRSPSAAMNWRRSESLVAAAPTRQAARRGAEPISSRMRRRWSRAMWLAEAPQQLVEEAVEELLSAPNVRIERIVSMGHATAADEWYDQGRAEWVLLLAGAADSFRRRHRAAVACARQLCSHSGP